MRTPRKKTEAIEPVETHNLALSIKRLRNMGYCQDNLKRSLYHALLMNSGFGYETMGLIREALKLP